MSRAKTFLVLASLFLGAVLSAQEMQHAKQSNPAFDQLKSLAGEWEGKDSSGHTGKIIYSVVSNGSAVMEHMQPASKEEMITMYTVDGDRIMVTHYCAAGNQPTMQSAPLTAATGKYDFTFVRVSGTKSPDEGHMVGLVLTITDKDHLTQEWTYQDHGKSSTETFNFTRVKS